MISSDHIPSCLSEVFSTDAPPLALNFHCRDGRIHSFPYGHLLYVVHEANPNADLQPSAPPERVCLSFSTHDVILFGWHLKSGLDLIGRGRLGSVRTLDERYRNLAKNLPFITDISICSAQTVSS